MLLQLHSFFSFQFDVNECQQNSGDALKVLGKFTRIMVTRYLNLVQCLHGSVADAHIFFWY